MHLPQRPAGGEPLEGLDTERALAQREPRCWRESAAGPCSLNPPGSSWCGREALNRVFEAREELILPDEPERVPVLRFFWRGGEPTGETIPAGEQVRVTDVKESPLGWRRFVWVKVETSDDPAGSASEAASEPQEEADDPAEHSAGGEETAEASDTATVTGWVKLGGQHRAIGSLTAQFERVGKNPGR